MIVRWTVATAAGFALTGAGLHSPGASAVGGSYLEWDVSAAVFGALLGAIAGAFTGLLQLIALRRRRLRPFVATVATVAIAHALADGAPGVYGVAVVAGVSAIAAALAVAWATGDRAPATLARTALGWSVGWLAGVAIAGVLSLSNGTTPGEWAMEHAVIGAILGLAFGAATAPAMRRILATGRALSSAG